MFPEKRIMYRVPPMLRRLPSRVWLCLLLLAAPLAADTTKPQPMSKQTRMQMIRLLNAEYAFVRLPLPMGEKGIVIKPDGKIYPAPPQLRMMVAKFGEAARPGQRVQITDVEIKDKSIFFAFNGGGVKKRKWYQRISVSGSGGEVPLGDQPDPLAKGSFLTVEFAGHVPEMTLEDLKKILNPVLDFAVKSAAQAYTESLPENVRNAIRDHKVLVGMNKEMVTYAKGRPPQRIREKDETTGNDYEEWIFGTPPEDVEFVRFTGEEVTQLKIMKVDGEKIIKTEKEVHLEDPAAAAMAAQGSPAPGPVGVAQADPTQPASTGPAKAPSLRRPGEAPAPMGGGEAPRSVPTMPPQNSPDPDPTSPR